MFRLLPALSAAALLLAASVPAHAQELSVFDSCEAPLQARYRGVDRDPDARRLILSGGVTIVCDDTTLFADELEVHDLEDGTRIINARGHVTLTQPDLSVSADAAEFNGRTRYGVFHNAAGRATIAVTPVEMSMFGTHEPHLYFWGERVERTGEQTYKLTNAGFTTCLQPTRRWEIGGSSGTVTLDKRVLLRNAILRVKNVPLLYLPVIYYPLSDDDRSTGFLIPTYSSSTIRGTGLSNAFFLAMGRSQDATFYHDWYSKSGQGFGSEYRYVAAPGSEGNARFYMLDEKDRLSADGQTVERTARRSFDVRGNLNQALPRGFRVYGRANYFSDASTRQLYNQNVFDYSQRERYFGATLTGNFGRYQLTSILEQRDFFFGENTAQRQGRLPTITLNVGQKPIGKSSVYFGASADLSYLLRHDNIEDPATDHSLLRIDASPSLRVPVSKLPFLSVTATAKWRFTRWQESLDPLTFAQMEVPLNRQIIDLGATVVGPVMSKVWQTPDNGYAERFKHLIEPSVTINWLSPFDQLDQVVKIDGVDYLVGGTTTVTYGVTNRLLARRRAEAGAVAGAGGAVRDILTVRLTQTYYSNQLASAFDPQYQSATGATSFSPIRLNVDTRPTDSITARFNTEIDPEFRTPRQYAASGSYAAPRVQVTAGWSKRQFIEGLRGYDNEFFATHFLNASTTVSSASNIYGGTYAFNFDVKNSSVLQQRIVAYYNAQCCGIQFDYQTVNTSRFGLSGIPSDRRFSVSFTLAGIGSFSNPFGSFGAGGGR